MSELLYRVSVIAVATGLLAACATATPEYPSSEDRTPPPAEAERPEQLAATTPPPPESAPSPPPAYRRPTTDDVGPATPLPPAVGPAPQPYRAPPSPQPAYRPPPPSPPPVQTVRLTVQGPVRAADEKLRKIKVEAGDTVNILSARLLTPKATLIKINRLRKPYSLDVGQTLKIPTPKAYVVQSGDTLFAIARRFELAANVLAQLNHIDLDERLRVGQQIGLPTSYKDNGPARRVIAQAASQPAQIPPAPAAPPPPVALAPVEPPRGARPPPVDAAAPARPPLRTSALPPPLNGPPVVDRTVAPSDMQVAAAGRGKFAWPVRGTPLSGFGPKSDGQRNDGVDIAAPMGTPVKAAAAGDVVYAGNQVPGFGNLVLIKHDDGWVTAYAHLSATRVKIKDHVEQGDPIGEVGQTGGADQPKLHFEVRYAASPKDKAKPIDPALVLPGR